MKHLLTNLRGITTDRIPFWFMRQAGRHLPEYRKIRQEAGSFLNLCYTPDLATEVTLQPVRRYQTDGAILFSDILVIPDALGQKVRFESGHGPVVEPVRSIEDIKKIKLDALHNHLEPVYQTIKKIRYTLDSDVTLLGFCGAPWTVASYMIEGGSSRDFALTKKWAYTQPDTFQNLIDLLIQASSEYLIQQLSSGADAVQIFDSWAGVLNETGFMRWCVKPTAEIVKRVRSVHPDSVIIGFPRNVGPLYEIYVQNTHINAVSIDTTIPPKWAANYLQRHVCVQGNLDPYSLVAGGKHLETEINHSINTLKKGPYVFNLGHGVVPETPIEHVMYACDYLRSISLK